MFCAVFKNFAFQLYVERISPMITHREARGCGAAGWHQGLRRGAAPPPFPRRAGAGLRSCQKQTRYWPGQVFHGAFNDKEKPLRSPPLGYLQVECQVINGKGRRKPPAPPLPSSLRRRTAALPAPGSVSRRRTGAKGGIKRCWRERNPPHHPQKGF